MQAKYIVIKGLKVRVPTMAQLEQWNSDCGCEATDGCWVEPDGVCEHGHESWLLYFGMI